MWYRQHASWTPFWWVSFTEPSYTIFKCTLLSIRSIWWRERCLKIRKFSGEEDGGLCRWYLSITRTRSKSSRRPLIMDWEYSNFTMLILKEALFRTAYHQVEHISWKLHSKLLSTARWECYRLLVEDSTTCERIRDGRGGLSSRHLFEQNGSIEKTWS